MSRRAEDEGMLVNMHLIQINPVGSCHPGRAPVGDQMEIAHARLSSLIRNFLVKYADDITFDYVQYAPVEHNRNKHPFFRIISRDNEHMEHLSLLARMLLVEKHAGPKQQ